MEIAFSLFGRPRELSCCLRSLSRCEAIERFSVHFDINMSDHAANIEVREIVDDFVENSGISCSLREFKDGYGPDRNIFRTLKGYNERVLYCAGDVLFHPRCLTKYLELNDRFPNNPISLYHSFAHTIEYFENYAVLGTFAFESLLFNPSKYFDYCLFTPFIMSKVSTTDWLLNWVFHRGAIKIYSDHFSYIQHLGVTGGNTSGRYPPAYSLDYIDQPGFFAALREIGVDLNTCKLVKNKGSIR